MPRYNLVEYSDNYSKRSRTLYQFWRDIPVASTIKNKH